MKCWEVASSTEVKQFEAISSLLKNSPQLIEFVFDPTQPKLRRDLAPKKRS